MIQRRTRLYFRVASSFVSESIVHYRRALISPALQGNYYQFPLLLVSARSLSLLHLASLAPADVIKSNHRGATTDVTTCCICSACEVLVSSVVATTRHSGLGALIVAQISRSYLRKLHVGYAIGHIMEFNASRIIPLSQILRMMTCIVTITRWYRLEQLELRNFTAANNIGQLILRIRKGYCSFFSYSLRF